MKETSSHPNLLLELQASEPITRLNAALSLAHFGNMAGLSVILEAFDHSSETVRRYHVPDALLHLGSSARPAVVQACTKEDSRRVLAAYTLYRLDPHQHHASSIFEEALSTEEERIQADTLWALRESGLVTPAIVAGLQALLHSVDQQPYIRTGAAEVLAQHDLLTVADIPILVSLLQNPAWEVRSKAAEALGTSRSLHQQMLPTIVGLLQDHDLALTARLDVLRLLGRAQTAGEGISSALSDALDDTNWWIRLYALRTIGALAQTAQPPLSDVIRALDDPMSTVRRNAAFALAQIGPAAEAAIPRLIQMVATVEDDMSGLVAETLARIGPSVLPHLVPMLTSSDDTASARAAYALQKLATPEASRELFAWLEKRSGQPFVPHYEHFYFRVAPLNLDTQQEAVFNQVWQSIANTDEIVDIPQTTISSKSDFLRFLVKHHPVILHGSNEQTLQILQPVRQSRDDFADGNESAVYGIPDWLLPMYFAIVNRSMHVNLNNGVMDGEDARGNPCRFYQFAVNVEALIEQPWTQGTVYILPRAPFEPGEAGWFSRTGVRPLARLRVMPEDFPLLAQIRGFDMHGPLSLNLAGFPFLDDVHRHPVRW